MNKALHVSQTVSAANKSAPAHEQLSDTGRRCAPLFRMMLPQNHTGYMVRTVESRRAFAKVEQRAPNQRCL